MEQNSKTVSLQGQTNVHLFPTKTNAGELHINIDDTWLLLIVVGPTTHGHGSVLVQSGAVDAEAKLHSAALNSLFEVSKVPVALGTTGLQ